MNPCEVCGRPGGYTPEQPTKGEPRCSACGEPVFWCAVREHWVSWALGGDDEIDRDVAATYRIVMGDRTTDVGTCAGCWCEIDALEPAA